MANLPCVIVWGQSNAEGIGQYGTATDQDMTRWYGATYATLAATFPISRTSPGIHYWQCEMPHGTDSNHKVSAFDASGLTITDSTFTFAANLATNAVAFITDMNTNLAGAGQVRAITVVAGSTLTVTPAFSPVPNVTAADYFSTLYGGKSSGASAGVTITNTYGSTFTTAFPSNSLVGKYLYIISGTGVGAYRKIVTYTNTTVTVDAAVGVDATSYFVFLTNGTLDISTYNGKFSDQSLYASLSPAFVTGYDYQNTRSQPLITPAAYGTQLGADVQLAWRMQNEFSTDVWVIKLGIPSAYMSRFLGNLTWNNMAWFRDGTHNDWAPGSTAQLTNSATYDLFDVLFTTVLTAAKNWVTTNRPGDTLDVVGCFSMEGESDAGSSDRYTYAKKNMAIIRDTARSRIAALGLTSKTATKIPWVIGGINSYSGWTYRQQVNDAFSQLEADDSWTGYVDTSTFSMTSPGHFDTQGLISLGNAWADKWVALTSRYTDADQPNANRISLTDMRTRVKARYEGNTTQTDATNDQVDRAINDAVREITNRLGDTAWFLRRSDQFSLYSNSFTPYTFPKRVRRVIMIRDGINPRTELRFNMVGYTNEGCVSIIMPTGTTTTQSVWVDYIEHPRDMEEDSDVCVIPYEYTELVVLLATKRLAERGGNQLLMQLVTVQAEEIWKGVWRQAHAQDRARFSGWHADPERDYRMDWLAGRDGPWLYS